MKISCPACGTSFETVPGLDPATEVPCPECRTRFCPADTMPILAAPPGGDASPRRPDPQPFTRADALEAEASQLRVISTLTIALGILAAVICGLLSAAAGAAMFFTALGLALALRHFARLQDIQAAIMRLQK
jgi:hypothetical protein